VPKLKIATSDTLQVRIGIATGLVVVGDLIGAGAAQEQAVVGNGGFVAKYMGDGVLAYFGYPSAWRRAARLGVSPLDELGAAAMIGADDRPQVLGIESG
jgi:class 3 adenylate cyclase